MPLLTTMRGLTYLDLRENDVVKDRKYREQVIMEAKQLKELDGKVVRQQDRQYLYALQNQKSRKRGGRSASLGANDRRGPRSNSYQPPPGMR